MPQYVEGPEAKGMESGFALDELLRKERGDTARTMFGAATTLDRQKQAQRQSGVDAATQQRYALERMVKGEDLKEQYAQKEAMRSAPFLQQMIAGNPDAAKAFGYTTPVPAQNAVPEAGYAGAPATTTPRMPSLEEASGLSRAVPGIAQALLTKKLEGAGKPMVVGENASLVSPEGKELYKGTGRPVQSREQAESIQAEMIAKNPALKGRVTIQQDERGSWSVKEAASESLVETPNKWLADAQDMNKPYNERLQSLMKYDKWKKDQVEIAGGKALEVAQMTPYAGEAKQRLEASNMAMQAAYRLQTYTKQEREGFTGMGMLGKEIGRYLQEGGLPPLGYSPEQIERYSDFKKDNGMVEQMKFAIGGKQLTEGEQRVVNAFIPTGREFTTAEYEAKLKGLVKAMEAAQVVDYFVSNSAKVDVTPQAIRELYVKELGKRGIDVTKSNDVNTQQNMRSGDRLRNKYMPGGGK